MPRTILLLTNRIPYPLRDGGALAMDAMIRGYQAAGWQVYLLAMHTARHRVSPQVLGPLYSDIAGFHAVAVDNTVSKRGILKNFFFSREPEHAARFKNEAFIQKLRQLLRDIQPDAVQLESPFLAAYIPVIRESAAPALVVYRMHNVEGQIWARLAAESSGLKSVYLKSLAKRMARYELRLWRDADLLLPITEADAAVVRKAGVMTPVEVAPFGIHFPLPVRRDTNRGNANQRYESDPLPPGPFKAYHLGAMDWLPNREAVRWFIDAAWPLLHRYEPRISFHFAGRAMPDTFRQSLPEGVYCEGEVADAQAFIRDKHILVVPLRSGGGIRIKILEAMAAGKLVISTDIGMQGIGAQPHLHYLNAASAQEFAHLIAWADAHPQKAAAIAASGQELVRERYDAAAIMHRVVQRLESLCR